MALTKPPGIESDASKSAKWDEITAGRDFESSARPRSCSFANGIR